MATENAYKNAIEEMLGFMPIICVDVAKGAVDEILDADSFLKKKDDCCNGGESHNA